MMKHKLAVVFLGFAMAVSASVASFAQTESEAPTAPLPAQIVTAKTVFISNAGAGPDKNFNEFYAAIKNWGRYEIVAAPANADLVLEISFASQITDVGGSKESGCNSRNESHFKLQLLDPKTRIVLWTNTQTIEPFFLQKTGEKNTSDAIKRLAGDLKLLAAPAAASAK
jgi:hypothetical protein